jgi:ribosomal protein S27E
MPKFELQWAMELEHLQSVTIKRDTKYRLRVECMNCREQTPEGTWVYLDPQEQVELTGSRGVANLVIKCKGCRRENSIQIRNSFSLLPSSFSPVLFSR